MGRKAYGNKHIKIHLAEFKVDFVLRVGIIDYFGNFNVFHDKLKHFYHEFVNVVNGNFAAALHHLLEFLTALLCNQALLVIKFLHDFFVQIVDIFKI